MGGFSYIPGMTAPAFGTTPGPYASGYSFPKPASTGSNAQLAGVGLAAASAAMSMVGGFYAIKSKQYELKQQSSALEYQKTMAGINASLKEGQAMAIMEAGQREAGRYSAQAGAAKSAKLASQAASGVVLGKGSSAEVIASGDVVKQIDMLTMNSNTVRAAEAQRMEAQSIRAGALMMGAQAEGLRATRQSMSPWLGAMPGLLSGGSQVAMQTAMYYGLNPYSNRGSGYA
jgi:hypothetical protein